MRRVCRPHAVLRRGLVLLCLALPAVAADLPRVEVTIVPAGGAPARWLAELAATPRARQQGLMWRRELAAATGMLFDFGSAGRVAMWMQDTYVPLDMLFIAADGRLVEIHAQRRPLSTTVESAAADVRYVLEINAGEAARAGLAPGAAMTIRALP